MAGDEDQRERRFCRLYGTARRVIAKRYRSASRWHNLLGRLAAEQRPRAAEWADSSARERLRTRLGADSQADRPVPAVIKPNGVTDGS